MSDDNGAPGGPPTPPTPIVDDIAAFRAQAAGFFERVAKILTGDATPVNRFKWFGKFGDGLDLAWKFARGVGGLIIFCLGLYVLANAYSSHGLVIEPFAVPADVATKDFDGISLAARLDDRLVQLMENTNHFSIRAPATITGDWGDDRKVEIPAPDAFGQQIAADLERIADHQTYVSAQLYHAEGGYGLTIRVDHRTLPSIIEPNNHNDEGSRIACVLFFAGCAGAINNDKGGCLDSFNSTHDPNQDMSLLVARAAIAVLKQTQPYRYALLLGSAADGFDKRADFETWCANTLRKRETDLAKTRPKNATGKSLADAMKYAKDAHDDAANASTALNRAGLVDLAWLVKNGPNQERPWAYAKWAEWKMARGQYEDVGKLFTEDARSYEDQSIVLFERALYKSAMGDSGGAFDDFSLIAAKPNDGVTADYAADAALALPHMLHARIDDMRGDYTDARAELRSIGNLQFLDLSWQTKGWLAADCTRAHDTQCALDFLKASQDGRCVLKPLDASGTIHDTDSGDINQFETRGFSPVQFFLAADCGNWNEAASFLANAQRDLVTRTSYVRAIVPAVVVPWRIYALARSGAPASAKTLAATMTVDQSCYFCVVVRAMTASAEGDYATANNEFRGATALAQKLPLAYVEWGRSYMQQKKYEEATNEFTMASDLSPKYADAIELWGEALLFSGDTGNAITKFQAAGELAPNWAHLHVMWGRALDKSGARDVAKQHYALARTLLDLSTTNSQFLALRLKSP